MTKTEAKTKFDNGLNDIKAKQKQLRADFKAAIDKAYADQRAAMKTLREQKKQLWTEYNETKSVEKAARKEAAAKAKTEKLANKGAVKRGRPPKAKIDAAEVIAKGEAALKKAKAAAEAKIAK